jgi:hypothetical protein
VSGSGWESARIVAGDYDGGWRWNDGGRGCGAGGARSGDVVETGVDGGLPLGEGRVEIDVAVNPFCDADAAECREFRIEVLAEFAEVLVAGVAERKYGIGEVSTAGEVFEAELLVEGFNGIGCITFAISADDEDGIALCEKCGRGVALKGDE